MTDGPTPLSPSKHAGIPHDSPDLLPEVFEVAECASLPEFDGASASAGTPDESCAQESDVTNEFDEVKPVAPKSVQVHFHRQTTYRLSSCECRTIFEEGFFGQVLSPTCSSEFSQTSLKKMRRHDEKVASTHTQEGVDWFDS